MRSEGGYGSLWSGCNAIIDFFGVCVEDRRRNPNLDATQMVQFIRDADFADLRPGCDQEKSVRCFEREIMTKSEAEMSSTFRLVRFDNVKE